MVKKSDKANLERLDAAVARLVDELEVDLSRHRYDDALAELKAAVEDLR